MLTSGQMTTLAAALRAEPTLATAVAVGDTHTMAAWCNANSTQDAWMTAADKRTLFEATDVAKFDTVAAGKRDAWKLMMDNAPIDFTRNKARKAAEDVWGADAAGVLAGLVRKATNAEKALGGTDATNSTVTAWKLNWTGTIGYLDVAQSINANPV